MPNKKESPGLAGGGAAVLESGQQLHSIKNPRQRRVLNALLERAITREQADKIARASNSPDIVFRLRCKGVPIQTTIIRCADADGRPSHYGRYWLRQDDKPAIRAMLEVRP